MTASESLFDPFSSTQMKCLYRFVTTVGRYRPSTPDASKNRRWRRVQSVWCFAKLFYCCVAAVLRNFSSKVISTRSLLNEWACCAHAYTISKFINKGESHDKNVAKSVKGGGGGVVRDTNRAFFLCLRVSNMLFRHYKRYFNVSPYSRS